MTIIKPNLDNSGRSPSFIDSFSGDHTNVIIVGVLVVCILLILAFSNYLSLSEKITSNFFNALMALIGYFIGSQKNKKD